MSNRATTERRRLGFLPGWRVFTYVVLAFNLIMLIWIISGAASNGSSADCQGANGQAVQTGCQVGTGIAVILLVVIWALGDVILGVLWLVTKPRGRDCPACGERVKRGVMQCRSCGYDFHALVNKPTPTSG